MKSLKIYSTDRFALLGASRGLGWCTYQELYVRYPEAFYFLASRKILDRKEEVTSNTKISVQDFSKVPVDQEFLSALKEFAPSYLIYFAGGGPYGFFEDKNWTAHQWALTTTFLYPAQLLHEVMSNDWPNLKQIIFIGSTVAEDKPDPMAASYASAKHALKGLIDSLNVENKERRFKISLFSPGYMQTSLIPQQSKAYQKAESTKVVAQRLLEILK